MTASSSAARLRISGQVARPRDLSVDELHRLAEATDADGAGPPGRMVPVGAVVSLAVPTPQARYVTFLSGDGRYRACIPLAEASAKGRLFIGVDAAGLLETGGGPVRLIVDGGDTLCWNVKGVAEIRLVVEKEPDSVPENPPH